MIGDTIYFHNHKPVHFKDLEFWEIKDLKALQPIEYEDKWYVKQLIKSLEKAEK